MQNINTIKYRVGNNVISPASNWKQEEECSNGKESFKAQLTIRACLGRIWRRGAEQDPDSNLPL
jgi:hypothetical protein